jgi:hypothetical protein
LPEVAQSSPFLADELENQYKSVAPLVIRRHYTGELGLTVEEGLRRWTEPGQAALLYSQALEHVGNRNDSGLKLEEAGCVRHSLWF